MTTQSHAGRVFAIIPAAGHSRRMGSPKLLLPWREGTVIDEVLSAWTGSQVTRTIIIVRSDDHALQTACSRWPVDVVRPDHAPADMIASIQAGLRHIADHHHPSDLDRWMVAPADLPTLTTEAIDFVVESSDAHQPSRIVVPVYGEKRGHPVLLPWAISGKVLAAPPGRGLDYVISNESPRFISRPRELRPVDMDTLREYEELVRVREQADSSDS